MHEAPASCMCRSDRVSVLILESAFFFFFSFATLLWNAKPVQSTPQAPHFGDWKSGSARSTLHTRPLAEEGVIWAVHEGSWGFCRGADSI